MLRLSQIIYPSVHGGRLPNYGVIQYFTSLLLYSNRQFLDELITKMHHIQNGLKQDTKHSPEDKEQAVY